MRASYISAVAIASGCRGEPLPAATDPAPESYGTLAAHVENVGIWAPPAAARAPMVGTHDQRRSLFGRTKDRIDGGPLVEALLVCKLSVSDKKNWDAGAGVAQALNSGRPTPLARPDVSLALHLGDEPSAAVVHAKANRRIAYVTVPHVDLRPGAPVHVRVTDRDLARDDPMGEARGTYEGTLPLKLESEYFGVECHAMNRSVGEWQMTNSVLPRLDHALTKMGEATTAPDPNTFVFQLALTLDAFDRGAAYTGWADPRALKRREQARERVQAFVTDVAGPSAAARVELDAGRITIEKHTDGCAGATPAEWPCVLGLRVTSTVPPFNDALPNRVRNLFDVSLLLDSGRIVRLKAGRGPTDQPALPPGVEVDQPFTPANDRAFDPGRDGRPAVVLVESARGRARREVAFVRW